MTDPSRNKHHGDDCSREAWHTIEDHVSDLCVELLAEIELHGDVGRTLTELAADRCVPSYRISGRITTLKACGYIQRNGKRESAETGCMCAVHVITDKGRRALERKLQSSPVAPQPEPSAEIQTAAGIAATIGGAA